jgi:preprotein translocase subunit SecY
MAGGFEDAVKIPELRRRVLFTIFMLIIYRVGVFVPTPGIDAERIKQMFERASTTLFGIVNMFSGGALENFSILALGITPYISVSIIVQLLAKSVKQLEELQKEGEQGRRILTKYTRIGTMFLAMCQGFAIGLGLQSQGLVLQTGTWFLLKTAITLTAGTAFIMWIGEQITERGIGNGISLIIMVGIVARMPSALSQTFMLMNTGELGPFQVLSLLLFGFAVVAFIVFVERCQRRIPVQYPRRAVGRHMTQAMTQHLPLKINSAGVIPAIFASALLVLPATLAQFSGIEQVQNILAYMPPGGFVYESIFALLIIFFSYFYTSMVFEPAQIAENLKKNGGFIPTVRPGRDTAEFLERVLARLTLWGSLYICLVCIVPSVFYNYMNAGIFASFFGGTAVLIAVGVTLDTTAQVQSHIVARNYEGFLKKGPGKIRGAGRGGSAPRGKLIRR